jgi:hypothetical protein
MRTAYLVAGDEDVREGVSEAQDRGVRVVLLGVEGIGPSYTLIQEADEYQVLPRSFWLPWVTRADGVSYDDRTVKGFGRRQEQSMVVTSGAESTAFSAGRRFAEDWSQGMALEEIDRLLTSDGWIPPELHGQMLRAAEAELGPLWDRADLKQVIRNGFRAVLRERADALRAKVPSAEDNV